MQENVAVEIANDLSLPAEDVSKALALLEQGLSIPYLVRYRPDDIGGLSEQTLFDILDRVYAFEKLCAEKEHALAELEKEGKLTDDLRGKLESCSDRMELKDLLMPLRKGRRTRGQVALELGLEPLALRILEQKDEEGLPNEIVEVYGRSVSLSNPEEALDGAKDIIAERIFMDPEIRSSIRDVSWREGELECHVLVEPNEFSGNYESFNRRSEPVRDIRPARFAAISHGLKNKQLSVRIKVDPHEIYAILDEEIITNPNSIWKRTLLESIRNAYERLLAPHIESELRERLRQKSDSTEVSDTLKQLDLILKQAPLGNVPLIALDGSGPEALLLILVDENGNLVEEREVPIAEAEQMQASLFAAMDELREIKHPAALAVRKDRKNKDSLKLLRRYLQDKQVEGCYLLLMDTESSKTLAGSSVFIAETQQWSVRHRQLLALARSLQNPLKQYLAVGPLEFGRTSPIQSESPWLKQRLLDTVRTKTVAFGVDVNEADATTLRYIPGLDDVSSQAIVADRTANGAFGTRQELSRVNGLSGEQLDQAAGFLRVKGENPLDATGVHPQHETVVQKIAADSNLAVADLIGNRMVLDNLKAAEYTTAELGEHAITWILQELAEPAKRDIPAFSADAYADEIRRIDDLDVGMQLSGKVKNVTNFGVFVDLGIGQDGMIHISELDHQYIPDPAQIFKTGDPISVKVIELDVQRKRIGLSRKQTLPEPPEQRSESRRNERRPSDRSSNRSNRPGQQGRGGRNRKRESGRDSQVKSDVIASGRMAELLKAALDKK